MKNASDNSSLLDVGRRARLNRAKIIVDLAAVRSNVDLAKSLHPRSKVMPVVKCDAYGLGAECVARDLQAHGVDGFGVESVYEAVRLRYSGIKSHIVALDGCVAENVDIALENTVIPGIATSDLLHAYNTAAVARRTKVPIWLYYNCGLNRSGCSGIEGFMKLVSLAKSMSNIKVECIYSQLSDSHNDFEFTQKQIAKYNEAIAFAREELGTSFDTSLYASHGIMSCSELFDTDWIRPGLMLYGEHCFSPNMISRVDSVAVQLAPALELRARLVQKILIGEDTTFSYTQRNSVMKGVVLGTVSIGYSGGLSSNDGCAYYLYNSNRLPLRSRAIGMDFSQVEIPEGCDIPMYAWITIFGQSGVPSNSLSDFSKQMKMSPYALLSSLKVAHEYQNSLLLEE